jgi:hypothetical protein
MIKNGIVKTILLLILIGNIVLADWKDFEGVWYKKERYYVNHDERNDGLYVEKTTFESGDLGIVMNKVREPIEFKDGKLFLEGHGLEIKQAMGGNKMIGGDDDEYAEFFLSGDALIMMWSRIGADISGRRHMGILIEYYTRVP